MTKQVSGKQSISYRNYRRARDRALARLSKLYPSLYKELLEEERRLDEQEGNTWSIAGDSKLTITTRARVSTVSTYNEDTDNQSQDQGYNGGEA